MHACHMHIHGCCLESCVMHNARQPGCGVMGLVAIVGKCQAQIGPGAYFEPIQLFAAKATKGQSILDTVVTHSLIQLPH